MQKKKKERGKLVNMWIKSIQIFICENNIGNIKD